MNRTQKRATRYYNHLLRDARPFIGSERAKTAPLEFVKRGGGYAYTTGESVSVNPSLARSMASKKKGARRSVRTPVLHEIGHIAGHDGEAAANHFANKTIRRINKQRVKRK